MFSCVFSAFCFVFFYVYIFLFYFFFFFQAEDGIRDLIVTGVQTCALPISVARHDQRSRRAESYHENRRAGASLARADAAGIPAGDDRRSVRPRTEAGPRPNRRCGADRKSTRLNSSHDQISYAVFCLKKKRVIRRNEG